MAKGTKHYGVFHNGTSFRVYRTLEEALSVAEDDCDEDFKITEVIEGNTSMYVRKFVKADTTKKGSKT